MAEWGLRAEKRKVVKEGTIFFSCAEKREEKAKKLCVISKTLRLEE
jgi:hypothetical protein